MIKVNMCKPNTHKGAKPADLIGETVLVRPYYHVPSGRSSLTSARSPYAFEARVIETFGEEMVKVRYIWATDSAPWRPEGIFYPHELHQSGWYPRCFCPACKGDGIHELRGA